MDAKSEDQAQVVLSSFFRIHRHFGKWLHATMGNHDLNVPQFVILQFLSNDKVVPQKTVGRKLMFPQSTLSSAVDKLVTHGFVIRIISEENRREVSLQITEAGKQKIKDIYEDPNGMHKKVHDILPKLPKESIETLLNLHQQFYELMQDETTENGGQASD
ncbi:MarR family winged helix-turn-helix transcriptional regulator [Ectobacillus polymachus]|uniref:MarR family winged helix-turn-helix transcriptional regulator n=1 Tax=Ectobacillus polymachus TaxID=1508806 RepID=UPI003A86E858